MARTLDFSKLAIVYARQSTPEQVAKNIYSTEGQLQLQDQALRDGFPADQVLVIDDDLGVSGRTIAGRVGMSKALRLMEQGLVAVVYAEDMTRLTRDEDTVDHMIIARHCKQSGALLYMAGAYLDMRSPGDRQLFKYQAVGASESWSQHLDKLHRAQRRKAEEGRVASGGARWGYRVNRDVVKRDPERDKLMIDEPEAAIIRGLAAKLLDAGSLRELFRQVDPAYWPDGSRIRFRTVARILTSPVYRGHYVWDDVTVENAHPAIIDSELAARIDRLLATNKTTRRKEAAHGGGVLVGLTWCPSCGRKIYGSLTRSHPEYRCQVKHPTEGDYHFSIKLHSLEGPVMQDLWAQLNTDLVGRIIKHLEGERDRAAAVVDFGEANQRALQRRLDGLTKSLEDPDISDAARKVLLAQLDQVARELDGVRRDAPANPHREQDLVDYRQLARQPDLAAALALTWQDEPLTWRRSWVRRFIERVDVTKTGRSSYDVAIHYLSGEVRPLALNLKKDVEPRELDLVRKLWVHPKRPARGWTTWMAGRLEAHGYQRSPRAISRLVRLAECPASSAR
jgi:DNA invertase Pin-like site-specific DNA recombinase